MEKNDGSSIKRGNAVKVLVIDDKPSVIARGRPPRNEALARAEMAHDRRCYEAAVKAGIITLYKDTPLSEIRHLFPKPNSKNSKRRERLNTTAGLPAKRRSFKRYLKRRCKSLGLTAPNAEYVETLWVSIHIHNSSHIFSLNRHTPTFDFGNSIFGSAANHVIEFGIREHDYHAPYSKLNLKSRQHSKGTTI